MNRLLATIPRNVLKALAVIAGALVTFGLSFVFIGGGLEQAIADSQRLQTEIQQSQTAIVRARDDHDYVQANQEKYERLLKSDRLIPHTRRAAVAELQRVAQQRGLTTLNYTFDNVPPVADAQSAANVQPTGAAYRLSVEYVTMKVGAPLDGPIYGFISDLTEQFPGSAIVDRFNLIRAREITDQALQAMTQGRESGLVTGEVTFLWRTAQAVEKDEAGAK